MNDCHRIPDVKQPDTQGCFSKQRTRTRQQSREQPVFPFAIFITQSFRSSIRTLTLTHTYTRSSHRGLGGVDLVEGKISFRSWWRGQRKTNWNRNRGKKISVALGIGVLLRLRRPRELGRRASLWISRRRGSWTIFTQLQGKRGVCVRNLLCAMLSCLIYLDLR